MNTYDNVAVQHDDNSNNSDDFIYEMNDDNVNNVFD